MYSLHCGNPHNRLGRCHTPLIEICDNTSQIKLDLGSCDPCATKPTALLLRRAGCAEWETICEEVPNEICCGVIDNRPSSRIIKRSVIKPKPSVLYPLHEIDPQGMSVFVLDDKLKELGYGRYEAIVIIDDCETELMFDVDYICSYASIHGIATEHYQANLGEC